MDIPREGTFCWGRASILLENSKRGFEILGKVPPQMAYGYKIQKANTATVHSTI